MRHYIPRVLAEHGVEYGTVYPDRVSKVVEWRAGDTHSRTIKRVCKSCNSGWMSRLQQAAKPILVPMLMGEAIKPGSSPAKDPSGMVRHDVHDC
jgi:hypothetical protein